MHAQQRNVEPVTIGGLRIEFPYVPYDCQKSFMQKVVEALTSSTNAALESPTGTGKTLSLLCASIAWVQREKERLKTPIQSNVEKKVLNVDPSHSDVNAANSLYPRIFYASRTHSQLQQIVRELNKTKYRSVIKVAMLAGRDQLCINEKVMKEENSEKRGHMCRSLVNKRGCHYYNILDKDSDLVEEIYNHECGGQAMDIEDLIATSRKLRHCPFYRSRQMYSTADLILLPYNYILDPKTRDAYQIKLRGNILIFDEAHNLEAIAEESMSVDFSTKALSLCIRECKKVLELIMEEEEALRAESDNSTVSFATLMRSKDLKASKKDQDKKLKKEDVATLLSFLQTFEEKIDALDLTKEGLCVSSLPGKLFSGNYMISLLESAGMSKIQRDPICRVIDQIGVFLATNANNNSGIWAEKGTNLADFSNFIAKVLVDTFEGDTPIAQQGWISKPPEEPKKNSSLSRLFQLYVLKENCGAVKFHYWCFSAGVAMRFLQSRGLHSIILASGTLSPIETFVSTMAIPFGSILENGHVAKPDQLIVGALRWGPANSDIVGTFAKRNDLTYKLAIGEILLQTVKITPQGVLAFFPSYSQLNHFIEKWKQLRSSDGLILWSALEKYKKIFVEPKDKAAVKEKFLAFDCAVREEHSYGGGALFLAVCRGKLSEGIDFADSHCRTVVIIGVPFPPVFDPKVILKKTFLEQMRMKDLKVMNPEDWYKVEGIRAVNQALGRIIRHKDDFGAVVLADGRYATLDQKMFPSWIRSAVKAHQGPETLFMEMERFFIERGALVELSHSRLQEDFNNKSVLISRKRRGPAIRCGQEMEANNFNKSVAELNAIAEMYGFTSQKPITLDDVEVDTNDVKAMREAVSETKELSRLDGIMNTLPQGQRVYPKKLELPGDARERALEAVALSTRRGVDTESVRSNNKKIKLKPNPKDSEMIKKGEIGKYFCSINGGATTSNKIPQTTVTRSAVEVVEVDLAGSAVNKFSAMASLTENDLSKPPNKTISTDELAPKIAVVRPSAKKKCFEMSNAGPSSHAMSSLSVILPKTVSMGVDESTACFSSSLIVDEKNRVLATKIHSLDDQLLKPPDLDMIEYKDLMKTLERAKRRQLWNAIMKYTRDNNYDLLVEQLGTVCLPDHPLVFTGFFGFVRSVEDRQRFQRLCNELNLLH